jgi:hypothetical protein
LLILSVTRSPIAVAAFRRWQEEPPASVAELPVDVLDYARRGGWALRPDGTTRDLCAPVAYQLRMVPTAPAGGGPVCPWCESPLWTVLDFDTSDPDVAQALAHTGWSGRLRITTCFLCSNYTTLFTDVTTDGGATWSSHNERPEYLRTSTEEPPAVLPEIGETRVTPYLASAWEEGGSTLGGFPDWIQDPAYPQCPACGETMDYVGLVGGADLGWGRAPTTCSCTALAGSLPSPISKAESGAACGPTGSRPLGRRSTGRLSLTPRAGAAGRGARHRRTPQPLHRRLQRGGLRAPG